MFEMQKWQTVIIRTISQSLITLTFCFVSFGQQNIRQSIWERLQNIENSDSLSVTQMILICENLKKEAEQNHKSNDSVYARILDRIAFYDFKYNNFPTNRSIAYAEAAVKIYTADEAGSSYKFAVNTYRNLGFFFSLLKQYDKSVDFYDSAVYYAQKLPEIIPEKIYARLGKSNILFLFGDYQRGADESVLGIQEAKALNNINYIASFFNMLAQFQLYLDQINLSAQNSDSAILYAKAAKDTEELVFAIKTQALIASKRHDYATAKKLFIKSIELKTSTNPAGKKDKFISNDYTDFGNFYLEELKDYRTAKLCYLKAIEYGKRASENEEIAKGYVNIGYANYLEKNYNETEANYLNAFRNLGAVNSTSLPDKINSAQLNKVLGKEVLLVAIGNTTELLLTQYKNSDNPNYLKATLQYAMLSDSIITELRHEQTGEQSKLYWRGRTREFFSNAVEASFEAKDPDHAFYFMEKSRAVLLNDKLNELGASAYLPKDLQLYEQNLRFNLIGQQQKLESLKEGTTEYDLQYQQYLEKKSAFDNYIKSLEKNYPAYYQYKYADSVPPLKALQEYLKKNNQAFIHYFISDSVVYILGISATTTTMIKHPVRNYNDSLGNFMQLCADEGMLNKNYSLFATYANHIYKTIFKDLNIPAGRVVICPDNFLVPFEALCRDKNGEKFLAYDYAFSYVYSASFLLKKFKDIPGKGNFLGLAPVNFSNSNHLPSLVNSDKFLKTSSGYYSGARLLTNTEATKKNFITMLPQYEIVNVFSHASADSSNSEPMLFLFDSSVKLSELQKIVNPSTKMVVLSACQTSVGRNATGEGIYSLARGFAAAGIPSVAATLWKADDLTTYDITQRFNEQISKGVRKDDALQQAKLSFLQKAGNEKSLPYYWANMILVGNADPVALDNTNSFWWYTGGAAVIVLMGLGFASRYRKKAA